MSAPPAEEPKAVERSPIEQAFDSIQDEDSRKLIAGRLTAMVNALDASKAEKDALSQKYDGLVQASSVNERMLKNQLQLFQNQLGEEMCNDYCLTDAHTAPAIAAAKEDPAQLMQVFERTMVAASKHMMTNGSASRKRKAAVADELTPEVAAASDAVAMAVVQEDAVPIAASAAVAAAAVPAAEDSDVLSRALAATFSH